VAGKEPKFPNSFKSDTPYDLNREPANIGPFYGLPNSYPDGSDRKNKTVKNQGLI